MDSGLYALLGIDPSDPNVVADQEDPEAYADLVSVPG